MAFFDFCICEANFFIESVDKPLACRLEVDSTTGQVHDFESRLERSKTEINVFHLDARYVFGHSVKRIQNVPFDVDEGRGCVADVVGLVELPVVFFLEPDVADVFFTNNSSRVLDFSVWKEELEPENICVVKIGPNTFERVRRYEHVVIHQDHVVFLVGLLETDVDGLRPRLAGRDDVQLVRPRDVVELVEARKSVRPAQRWDDDVNRIAHIPPA